MASGTATAVQFEECAHCGASFERDVWYPVVTRRDEDGELLVFSFCDDDCQAAWEAEN